MKLLFDSQNRKLLESDIGYRGILYHSHGMYFVEVRNSHNLFGMNNFEKEFKTKQQAIQYLEKFGFDLSSL